LLLALAGIPIAILYVWRTLILPAITGSPPGDFSANYMAAAAKIAAGRDPYDLCLIEGCAHQAQTFMPLPLAGVQYVTPPPVAWMLQPLVGTDARVQLLVVIGVLQLSLAVFLVTTLRAAAVKDWQLAALLVLVTIGFEPVTGNFDEGQVNLVLLALSGVWLLGWVAGDRWWGGAAVGAAVAIKLLQAPLGLLLLWGRRWRMVAWAALAGAALWLLAVPQYLPEYLFKVSPVLAAGTGLFENHSPGGTVARLLDPGTFFGAVRNTPPAAPVITTTIALAALAVTFWVLRRPRTGRSGRALEAAAVVAVGPMVASYSVGHTPRPPVAADARARRVGCATARLDGHRAGRCGLVSDRAGAQLVPDPSPVRLLESCRAPFDGRVWGHGHHLHLDREPARGTAISEPT
jgi:Glycosyltransferase family 87